MPVLTTADGEIYYEVHGSGFPLMIFAPGGLRSELAFWRHSPSNPSAPAVWMDPMAVLGEKYRVVAMDQRNAGRSRTGIFASERPTRDRRKVWLHAARPLSATSPSSHS